MAKHINFYKSRTGVENLDSRFNTSIKTQYIVIDGITRRVIRNSSFKFTDPKISAVQIRESINNLLYKSYLTEVQFDFEEGGRRPPSIYIGCGYVISARCNMIAHFEEDKVTVSSYVINTLTDPFTKYLKSQLMKATKDGWVGSVTFIRNVEYVGRVIFPYYYKNEELKDALAYLADGYKFNIKFKNSTDI
jgi:hypothetical protein